MCDFSALAAKRRDTPAQAGDCLRSQSITSHTIGFVDPKKPDEAVCMIQGTVLLVAVPEKLQREFGFSKLEYATFIRVDEDKPHTHHDALNFLRRGKTMKLNDLKELKVSLEVTVESAPEGQVAIEAESLPQHEFAYEE